MPATRWSRTDPLFLEGLLWAVPAVSLLDVVARAVRAARGSALEATGPVPDELLAPADPVTGPLSGTLVVEDPSAAQYAWDLVPQVLLLVLLTAAAVLLLGVVRSLRVGDPFTSANARRLTALGVLVVVGGLLLPMLQGIGHRAIVEPLVPDGETTTWTFDLALWPASFGILIGFLAEVFARGVRLREDVEGLV